MKRKNILLFSIALSAISICGISSELPPPNKKIEKITINVNGQTHIVWVNKTMIDMVKTSDLGEHQSSSVIIPAGYSDGGFSSSWHNFMQNRAIRMNESNKEAE